MKFIAAAVLFLSSVCHAHDTLQIQIIIPPVLDVTENVHPILVKPFEPVKHKLVIFSNMNRYCIIMRARGFPIWRPKLLSGSAVLEGRTLCSTHLGTSEFVFEHKFGNVGEISWPVTIEIVSP